MFGLSDNKDDNLEAPATDNNASATPSTPFNMDSSFSSPPPPTNDSAATNSVPPILSTPAINSFPSAAPPPPVPPTPSPTPASDPVKNDAPAAVPAPIPSPPAINNSSSLPQASSTLGTSSEDQLIKMKQQALQSLAPLIDHLEQTPEEKFKTTMMLIQASDNKDLLKEAYDAANQIPDEKVKAQALLDVVNEINYFTHQDNKSESSSDLS